MDMQSTNKESHTLYKLSFSAKHWDPNLQIFKKNKKSQPSLKRRLATVAYPTDFFVSVA